PTAVSKTIKFYFGFTAITLLNAATNIDRWVFLGQVIRVGATSQKISGIFSTAFATPFVGTATETLSNSIAIKFTGESTTTDYIQQHFLKIKYDRYGV